MKKALKLTTSMSVDQFDHGYWYAADLKAFAKELGIANSSKLRKDELEMLIKNYLNTGEIGTAQRTNISKKGIKDCELGLKPSLIITNYTSNKETKSFIEKEALKINPLLKRKSGARYRLNRWRDEQMTKGNKITYADLVKEYTRLNEREAPFEKIPHGRFINFLAAYLANEPDPNRKDAIDACKVLKKIDIPKDYQSWKRHQSKKTSNRS